MIPNHDATGSSAVKTASPSIAVYGKTIGMDSEIGVLQACVILVSILKTKAMAESEKPEPGKCQCGCGKTTKMNCGRPLLYFDHTHHPDWAGREARELKIQRKNEERREREKHESGPIVGQSKWAKVGIWESSVPKSVPLSVIGPSEQSDRASGDRINEIVVRMQRSPEFVDEQCRILGTQTREARRFYQKNRADNDVGFRILMNLRTRLGAAIRGKGKSGSTRKLLGCSIPELKAHLEKQFTPGMSWENYGAWHVDHIVPCCSFDLTCAEEQRRCFHFTNLQPLWADANFKKGGRTPDAP